MSVYVSRSASSPLAMSSSRLLGPVITCDYVGVTKLAADAPGYSWPCRDINPSDIVSLLRSPS